jgi:hypothetical protein
MDQPRAATRLSPQKPDAPPMRTIRPAAIAFSRREREA